MAFPARYSGVCHKCSQPFSKGQYINWSRRKRGKAYHVDCTEPSAIPEAAVTVPEPITIPNPTTNTQASSDLLSMIAQAIQPLIKANAEIDRDAVEAIVKEELAHATMPVLIDIKRETGEIKQVEGAHSAMPKLVYLLSKRHHAYLYGPPGSGKSTAARQAAEAIGWDYGYISLNPQTPDSRLLGFMDANGNYRDTVFYRLYKDGGVFCIDEVDNASSSLLTTLNSCLENGHAAFPCGMVKRHDNFVLVATGNTCGKGANPMFPERRPFDAAFSERLTFIEWSYDTQLEKAITLATNPDAGSWLTWVGLVRDYCKENHPKVLVTPRASFKGAEYLLDSNWSKLDIAEALIFKGLEHGTRDAILRAVPLS